MKFMVLLLMIVLLAACGSEESEAVPTLLELPTDAPNATTTITEESVVADTSQPPTATDNSTPTPEPTEAPTLTPRASRQPASRTPTQQSTSVVAILPTVEALPTNPPVDIPMVEADITITEAQFQEELARQVLAIQTISEVQVDFVAGETQGIRVRMTASAGQAFVTGDVFIAFQPLIGSVAIQILDISTGDTAPPQQFVDIALEELNTAVVDSFDSLIQQQLGTQHDLETISFTESTMQIMLLVPEN